LLQISLNNYYFSFYGIGDAIKAWKGCGVAQRRLCRSNKDDGDGDFGLPPACRRPARISDNDPIDRGAFGFGCSGFWKIGATKSTAVNSKFQ
jgi:hypothetical protein